ncbi:hypothetical protein BC834DRAFT_686389 [Gloeopeniophorella convolvens]|nr:hypothetical protein BC834DRAFT_686389 [Gloeopeniophorella convolvens]
MSTLSPGRHPMYISPHSAEVILSDFRPLKLQVDALQFLNGLLDEILASVISSAYSILTDRLKIGLLKTLSTTLGKDALLEAEMELRAYWQRPNAVKPSPAQISVSDQNFSLPLMIELMRLKCEAYSTLNDSDEDAHAEGKIQERLQSQGMEPPKSVIVAPAALYLTAILECICEHILSNVGRVATRDSSKEVAGTQDLFIALCEDDNIYPMFKVSKAHEAIEAALKPSSRPRRSKSFSRTERYETQEPPLPDSSPLLRSRMSSESGTHPAVSGSVGMEYSPPRTSLEKGRAIKLFKAHSRSSSDRDASRPSDALHRPDVGGKSFSAQSDGINDNVSLDTEEGSFVQEFDDLMRSGDTMKVSLTPDRLRTMESARQSQRPTRRTPRSTSNDHPWAPSTTAEDGRSSVSPEAKPHNSRRPSLPHVGSIVEDEEPKETASSLRKNQSLPGAHPISDVRMRAMSAPGIAPPNGQRVARKPSLGLNGPSPSPMPPIREPFTGLKSTPGVPPRSRRVQRNRESMDLDDIMNGSEDGSEPSPSLAGQTTPGRTRPHVVSKATNDLISFLEEGPPPEIQPIHSAAISAISLTPTTKSGKSGSRLQRMISKLNLAKEERVMQDSQRGRGSGIVSAPSTPSLSSQRSISSNYLPPLPVAVKPVPPPFAPPPQLAPISPPSSPSRTPVDDVPPQSTRNDRSRKMSVRKAVPNWEAVADQGIPAALIRDARMTPSPRPMLSPSPVPTPSPTPSQTPSRANSQVQTIISPSEIRDVNGHAQDSQRPLRTESPVIEPASPASAGIVDTPASRENVNGRADQVYHQGIYRPRSSRPNNRSSSINDDQPHSPRRPNGRRPQPSSGTVDRSQRIPATPSLSETLALDMRKLMLQATTADECRLLVDTFLTRVGIALPPIPTAGNTDLDSQPLERTLVEHLLGSDADESLLPYTRPTADETEPQSALSSTHLTSHEDEDLRRGLPTPPMDNVNSVTRTHHLVSAAA